MSETIFNPKIEFIVRKAQRSDAEAIATININSWKTTYRNVIDQGFLDSLQVEPRILGAIKQLSV